MASSFIPLTNIGIRCSRDGSGRFRSHSWRYVGCGRVCTCCGVRQEEYTDLMFNTTHRRLFGYDFVPVLSEKNAVLSDLAFVSAG